jgi:hypothetical protein
LRRQDDARGRHLRFDGRGLEDEALPTRRFDDAIGDRGVIAREGVDDHAGADTASGHMADALSTSSARTTATSNS